MGRSKKYHKYTAEQLTELATLTTRKQLKRFARLTKHPYTSVYNYWRKTTGKKLTDFDPTAKGRQKAVRRNTANSVVRTTNAIGVGRSVSLNITSLEIVTAEDGTKQLVITC